MRSYGFPAAFLQELKQKNDIVSVISRYLTLDRKGKTYWARCPFHGEKTPSFAVNEADQYYHCFGCKASGDVITFVKEMESVEYVEAVRMLAEWAGITVPNQTAFADDELKRRKAEKDRLVACMKEANNFYRRQLLSKEALLARDYLQRRKIGKDIIERFEIGFSPNFNSIINHLKEKGFDIKTQLLAGVIKEKNGRQYDALGERLVFPTINIYGEVVAFTGRTLKQNVDFAKYLNTAETPLFSKGKNLYGINLLKKRKQSGPIDKIIIVEGQFDVISLHQAGFDTAVASMGTALTKEQAKLIKRFSSNVYVCYDGDFAGQAATLRGLDILRDEGIDVRVMSLPDKTDPDDYIKAHGTQAFEKLINQALPLIEFKLTDLLGKYNLEEIDGKAKYTEAALEVLKEIPSEIEREAYIEFVQKHSGASKDTLYKLLRNQQLKQDGNTMPIYLRKTKHEGPFRDAQQCVIANILRNKPYTKKSEKLLNWLEQDYRDIYEFLLENNATANALIDRFADEEDELVGGIVNFDFLDDERINKQQFDDCLWLIYRTYLTNLQGEILEELKSNPQNRVELMKQIFEITQKIKTRKVEW